jgi:hypothetical protein
VAFSARDRCKKRALPIDLEAQCSHIIVEARGEVLLRAG